MLAKYYCNFFLISRLKYHPFEHNVINHIYTDRHRSMEISNFLISVQYTCTKCICVCLWVLSIECIYVNWNEKTSIRFIGAQLHMITLRVTLLLWLRLDFIRVYMYMFTYLNYLFFYSQFALFISCWKSIIAENA